MPLSMAGIGETNIIRRVGGNEETRRFLENLGFVAGAEVTVLVCDRGQCDRKHQGFTDCPLTLIWRGTSWYNSMQCPLYIN